MRPIILAFTAAALLLTAPTALAAPTCQDRDGGTIKCGVPGAMPVGWTLPPDQRLDRQAEKPAQPITDVTWSLIFVLVGFFGLIAVMPKFDGDWDRQEGDDDGGG